MSLVDFSAKSKTCDIKLVGGIEVELSFRPHTLADTAWLQSSFSEKDADQIANLDAKPLCKIIWNQLTSECKEYFSGIEYQKFNEETEKSETIRLMGYEKLFRSILDTENLLIAFTAFNEVRELNSFIDNEKKKSQKKSA